MFRFKIYLFDNSAAKFWTIKIKGKETVFTLCDIFDKGIGFFYFFFYQQQQLKK